MEDFMDTPMRIMTEKPLNAETPIEYLRSWITANSHFFDRNQGAIPDPAVDLQTYRLVVEGEVARSLSLGFEQLLRMPKTIVSNTLECSGNSRSLLKEKARGNPWTIGGVGNAVWGGIPLDIVLAQAGLKETARHVAFEGLDQSLGSSGTKFIRSIPLEKALDSTILAYEMNGEPLPPKHGFPLRGLALGWTGANCIKWLHRITVMARPYEGFFMDKVYRVFQKGQDPATGDVVTGVKLKSIITRPQPDESLPEGDIVVLGAAYGGEKEVARVEVSVDGGQNWQRAEFIGPCEPYAWRQWQYLWKADTKGRHTIMARAADSDGSLQPMDAEWNVLGYGNNGVREHAVTVDIT
jgi:DMSO/TMAO reductase YedYZ molybdopterin-dependent catalytic subunit